MFRSGTTFATVIIERNKKVNELKYDILKAVQEGSNLEQVNRALLDCVERYVAVLQNRIPIKNQHPSVFHFERQDVVLLFTHLFSNSSIKLDDLFNSNASNQSNNISFSDDEQAVLSRANELYRQGETLLAINMLILMGLCGGYRCMMQASEYLFLYFLTQEQLNDSTSDDIKRLISSAYFLISPSLSDGDKRKFDFHWFLFHFSSQYNQNQYFKNYLEPYLNVGMRNTQDSAYRVLSQDSSDTDQNPIINFDDLMRVCSPEVCVPDGTILAKISAFIELVRKKISKELNVDYADKEIVYPYLIRSFYEDTISLNDYKKVIDVIANAVNVFEMGSKFDVDSNRAYAQNASDCQASLTQVYRARLLLSDEPLVICEGKFKQFVDFHEDDLRSEFISCIEIAADRDLENLSKLKQKFFSDINAQQEIVQNFISVFKEMFLEFCVEKLVFLLRDNVLANIEMISSYFDEENEQSLEQLIADLPCVKGLNNLEWANVIGSLSVFGDLSQSHIVLRKLKDHITNKAREYVNCVLTAFSNDTDAPENDTSENLIYLHELFSTNLEMLKDLIRTFASTQYELSEQRELYTKIKSEIDLSDISTVSVEELSVLGCFCESLPPPRDTIRGGRFRPISTSSSNTPVGTPVKK